MICEIRVLRIERIKKKADQYGFAFLFFQTLNFLIFKNLKEKIIILFIIYDIHCMLLNYISSCKF